MDKISENLEKIFELDRIRIAARDLEVKGHIKGIKNLKRDRKKMADELDLLSPLRELDLVEFKKVRMEYYEKAGLAVAENAQLDEDIKTGRIDWAEHTAKRRKPEDIRTEWRKKFWDEYELTLTPIRERHAKILELEAKISFIDQRIVYKQNAVFGLEVTLTQRKLEDLKRYMPSDFRTVSVAGVADEKTMGDLLAKGKCMSHYILDITNSEDLLNLPLDARFIFDHLDLVYELIEKYRDFEFSPGDRLHLTYKPFPDMGGPASIVDQMILSENVRKNKSIIQVPRKDPALVKKVDTSVRHSS